MGKNTYVSTDSLMHLHASGLLDVAVDALEDMGDDYSPDQVQLAIDVIRDHQLIIAHEAMVHGLARRDTYSNGVSVRVTREESFCEPDDRGITRIGSRPVTCVVHPSGSIIHPVFGSGDGVA